MLASVKNFFVDLFSSRLQKRQLDRSDDVSAAKRMKTDEESVVIIDSSSGSGDIFNRMSSCGSDSSKSSAQVVPDNLICEGGDSTVKGRKLNESKSRTSFYPSDLMCRAEYNFSNYQSAPPMFVGGDLPTSHGTPSFRPQTLVKSMGFKKRVTSSKQDRSPPNVDISKLNLNGGAVKRPDPAVRNVAQGEQKQSSQLLRPALHNSLDIPVTSRSTAAQLKSTNDGRMLSSGLNAHLSGSLSRPTASGSSWVSGPLRAIPQRSGTLSSFAWQPGVISPPATSSTSEKRFQSVFDKMFNGVSREKENRFLASDINGRVMVDTGRDQNITMARSGSWRRSNRNKLAAVECIRLHERAQYEALLKTYSTQTGALHCSQLPDRGEHSHKLSNGETDHTALSTITKQTKPVIHTIERHFTPSLQSSSLDSSYVHPQRKPSYNTLHSLDHNHISISSTADEDSNQVVPPRIRSANRISAPGSSVSESECLSFYEFTNLPLSSRTDSRTVHSKYLTEAAQKEQLLLDKHSTNLSDSSWSKVHRQDSQRDDIISGGSEDMSEVGSFRSQWRRGGKVVDTSQYETDRQDASVNVKIWSPVAKGLMDEVKKSPYASPDYLTNLRKRSDPDTRKVAIRHEEAIVNLQKIKRDSTDEEMVQRVNDLLHITSRVPVPVEEPMYDREYEPIIEELEEEESEEEAEPELPELTEEQERKISAALVPRPEGQVLVEGFRLQITRKDFATLRGLSWLNDEIINFYMNLLMERGKADNFPSVYAFSTFFYPKVKSDGHKGVRRWTKQVDLFSHDFILIPVHLGMHWCLAVVDFTRSEIRYYDSMGGSNTEALNIIQNYIDTESKRKKKKVPTATLR